MRLGSARARFPRGRGWVFHKGNCPTWPLLTRRLVAWPRHNRAQGLPPPAPLLGDTGVTAPGCDPRVSVVPSFLSSTPCSDSWHRVGWNFAHASIHTYRLVAPGHGLCSLLARPFVCGCHRIVPIPPVWTIPGLPGSPTPLPHRVARTHRGAMGWNHTPSPPECRLDHSPSLADRFILGLPPLDYDPVVLRKPCRPHLAVGARPSGVLREGGFRSPLAVSGFRLCARIRFSIPASLSGR